MNIRRTDFPTVSDETWELFTAWKENRTDIEWYHTLTAQQEAMVSMWGAVYNYGWNKGMDDGVSIAREVYCEKA